MLIALVGVTGVGKSYYKEKIVEELNFKKVNTIRTRKIRKNEINGTSGLFLRSEELDELEKQGKLAYRFSVFGGEYAYLKEEIFTKENMIFEMHYTTIFDWKRIVPDIKTIYILPNDIEIAKQKTKERGLTKEKEEERIAEIEEHYDRFMSDQNLQKSFDYIVYNKYDKESEENIINLVKRITEKN